MANPGKRSFALNLRLTNLLLLKGGHDAVCMLPAYNGAVYCCFVTIYAHRLTSGTLVVAVKYAATARNPYVTTAVAARTRPAIVRTTPSLSVEDPTRRLERASDH